MINFKMFKREETKIICKTILENIVKSVIYPETEISESTSETSPEEQPQLSLASALESLTEESAKEIFGEAPENEQLSTDTSKVIANFIGNETKSAPSKSPFQQSKDQFLNELT